MKTKQILKTGVTVVFSLLLIFVMNGCSQDQIVSTSDSFHTTSDIPVIAYGKGKGGNNYQYPLTGSAIISLKPNGLYSGGGITLANGVSFSLSNGALTPPAEIPYGDDVTITVTCQRPNVGRNELVLEFGPHGCQFDPRAQVILDYSDLGVDLANLYYIDDNGNYVLQNPDQIDIRNKRMILYLDHFSRYALSAD